MTEQYNLSTKRRDLYFKVIDTHPEVHPISLRLFFLQDHFPPEKLDRALQWLIDSRLVGRIFVKWFETECKHSDLEMHRVLLSVVDNAQTAKLFAGKDFRL